MTFGLFGTNQSEICRRNAPLKLKTVAVVPPDELPERDGSMFGVNYKRLLVCHGRFCLVTHFSVSARV